MQPAQYSLELMAGQRLMLGFEGTRFNEDLEHIIRDIKAGGIILFKYNIESPDQLKQLIKECKACAAEWGLPPLFVSVDQEGGTVARLRAPFTEFKGNPCINTLDDAEHFARITAGELKGMGFNMNLAPVLDWIPDGVDSIMKERCFKGDVKTVSALGMQVIDTLQHNGIMAVAKHFPGIGRTVKDSHFHLPVLDIDPVTLQKTDMVPFVDAIDHEVTGVMLSHIFYPKLDDQWQASLSRIIARDILRDQLKFDGLVLTDDLDMKAIKMDMKTCIGRILTANIDLALICHKGPGIDIAHQEILRLMKSDEDIFTDGQGCLQRILRYKEKLTAGNEVNR